MSGVTERVAVGSSLVAAVGALLLLSRSAPPGLVPWFVAALLSCLGALEVARMGAASGEPLFAAVLAPGLFLALLQSPLGGELGWVSAERPLEAYLAGGLLVAAISAALAFLRRGEGRAAPPWLVAGLSLWVLPALYGWGWIDARWGTSGLFLVVLLSKVGDVFGYLVGRRIGVRRPFPRISPNKTLAGCVASLLAGIAAGATLAALECRFPGARESWAARSRGSR